MNEWCQAGMLVMLVPLAAFSQEPRGHQDGIEQFSFVIGDWAGTFKGYPTPRMPKAFESPGRMTSRWGHSMHGSRRRPTQTYRELERTASKFLLDTMRVLRRSRRSSSTPSGMRSGTRKRSVETALCLSERSGAFYNGSPTRICPIGNCVSSSRNLMMAVRLIGRTPRLSGDATNRT
jgi:hypothetical protein